MRTTRALVLALLSLPAIARAQVSDTIPLGERIRVRVNSTRGNTNLFIGTVSALTPDTLTLAIPGGKGTIILPRASINEVARPDGRESRLRNLPFAAPILYTTGLLATMPQPHGPHSNGLRNQRYILIGLNGLLVWRMIGRTPPERWTPVYRWLDRP